MVFYYNQPPPRHRRPCEGYPGTVPGKKSNRAGRGACHDISPSWSIQTYRRAQQIQKRRGYIDRSILSPGASYATILVVTIFSGSRRARAMPRYLVNATIYDALPYFYVISFFIYVFFLFLNSNRHYFSISGREGRDCLRNLKRAEDGRWDVRIATDCWQSIWGRYDY